MAEWHQNIEKVIAVPAPETQKTLWHISTASNQSYILVPGYQSKPDVLKVEWLESHLSYDVKWKMSLMDKTPSLKEQAGDSPVTFIKITEVSKTPNPFARFFMQYFLKYEASVEDYLQNLARHLEVPEAEIRELVT